MFGYIRKTDVLAGASHKPATYLIYALNRIRRVFRRKPSELAIRLHDEVGQWLAFAQIQIDRAIASNQEALDQLAPVRLGLKRSSKAIRTLIEDLDSGGAPSLKGSLQTAIDAALSDSPWAQHPLQLDLDPHLARISPASAPLVARIIRELVVNAHRHANASQVRLRVYCEDSRLSIQVWDNGDGMQVNRTRVGFGLSSLTRQVRHSGGHLDLWSVLGVGTSVTLTLPLKERSL